MDIHIRKEMLPTKPIKPNVIRKAKDALPVNWVMLKLLPTAKKITAAIKKASIEKSQMFRNTFLTLFLGAFASSMHPYHTPNFE